MFDPPLSELLITSHLGGSDVLTSSLRGAPETISLDSETSDKLQFDLICNHLSIYLSIVINAKINKKINVLQRSLLRRMLNIRYPKTISNAKLYHITKEKEWSTIITKLMVDH